MVRHLIHHKTIPATQVASGAALAILLDAVGSLPARQAAMEIKNRRRREQPQSLDDATLDLAGSSSDTEEGVPAP